MGRLPRAQDQNEISKKLTGRKPPKHLFATQTFKLVLLDEVNIALKLGYLNVTDVGLEQKSQLILRHSRAGEHRLP